jgi:hypothetical protein
VVARADAEKEIVSADSLALELKQSVPEVEHELGNLIVVTPFQAGVDLNSDGSIAWALEHVTGGVDVGGHGAMMTRYRSASKKGVLFWHSYPDTQYWTDDP